MKYNTDMKHVNHALDSTRELYPFLAGLGHKMAKDNYSPQKISKTATCSILIIDSLYTAKLIAYFYS